MKCNILVAFLATALPRAVLSAPVPVSMEITGSDRSDYKRFAETVARNEFSTDGRSGYNSVEVAARGITTNAETGGRSGYNSIEVTERDLATNAVTDGRSGYNSVEIVERKVTTDAETNGRSGYN
ncbi:hypothetical protein N8I77_006306 [Diaporthe amygdali]|uniref:Uncharacterized protein n=1 Tax=Phomopsis amygdali TaxID=1214568 RepID=A0AAD9W3N5_PHOAM|nr:hypothetical protein N8I77_006306 [Diaporthe amygdali]